MKSLFYILVIFQFVCFSLAQELTPNNGVKESKSKFVAIKNATVYVSSSKKVENATLLIEGNKIVKVGKIVNIPNEALIIEGDGMVILPSFIEVNSSIGLPKIESRSSFFPQYESNKNGAYYWNESIHPEVDATILYNFDKNKISELRKNGFGVISTIHDDGIAQGTSGIYSLGYADFSKHLINTKGFPYFSFHKGVSNQTYPSSLMGSIALLKQALEDAKWYSKAENKELNLSLEALNVQSKYSSFFRVDEKYDILRAQKIANEFQLNLIYIGKGDEYAIVDELKANKVKLVIPIAFPKAYDVTDPYILKEIPVSDLKHWEMAPFNALMLKNNDIEFAFSLSDMSPKETWKNIKTIMNTGISEFDILKYLAEQPANFLGIKSSYGKLEEGFVANFTIYDGNPFENKVKVIESWVQGEREVYETLAQDEFAGNYNIMLDEVYMAMKISGNSASAKASLEFKPLKSNTSSKKNKLSLKKEAVDTNLIKVDAKISVTGNDVIIQFDGTKIKWNGSVNLHAKYSPKFGILEGDAILPNGEWKKWTAIKNEKAKNDKKKQKDSIIDVKLNTWYPNAAFGFEERPKNQEILIKNATIWTNEELGLIEKGNVLVKNGKIAQVSQQSISCESCKVINGENFHLTSGIIDEHSHIAIARGVNEGGQAVSAEVSIGDVVDPEDINIYRQLSGGVTAAQLLHGSANPIGGQSALIKLKWGHTATDFLIPNAPKFIKFALGENVKQANWGDFNRTRFPQTRMGVEQIMYDAFNRAKSYDLEKKNNPNYRKDFELETLLEILNKERFISCHSYVQSEINMLMHVADSMGFTINTFTHILEGYKVADKMKAHGAGGSTFADWWAYKFEVNDAIPYNAAMMSKMGIVTAINSDDAEMGRRLNQEAGKTVKYGGLSEIDAWKTVTLNPAKLLHLDYRMGSIKAGKDADLVLWTENPLSIQAKVLYTIVDGEILYDATKNDDLNTRNARERSRIISLMSDEKYLDSKVQFTKKKEKHFHCNTIGEEASEEINLH